MNRRGLLRGILGLATLPLLRGISAEEPEKLSGVARERLFHGEWGGERWGTDPYSGSPYSLPVFINEDGIDHTMDAMRYASFRQKGQEIWFRGMP